MTLLQVRAPGRKVGVSEYLENESWLGVPNDGSRATTISMSPEVLTSLLRARIKRIIDFWPYIFVAISVTGFVYIAATTPR